MEKIASPEVVKFDTVAIIIPDRASGEDFAKSFGQENVKNDVISYEGRIAPRVIGDRINEDPKVTEDLATALLEVYQRGYRAVAIGCNTLQLWVDRARESLSSKGIDISDMDVTITLEAAKEAFPADERPLWLGTSPISNAIPKADFKTLANQGFESEQDLTQSIIWLTKYAYGSDIKGLTEGTKFSELKTYVQREITQGNKEEVDSETKEVIRSHVKTLVKSLADRGIHRVFLGCTELPMAFALVDEKELKEIDPLFEAIDPAVLAALRSKVILEELEKKKERVPEPQQ